MQSFQEKGVFYKKNVVALKLLKLLEINKLINEKTNCIGRNLMVNKCYLLNI